MVILRGSPESNRSIVQSLLAVIINYICHIDDVSHYRKFDRLETLRENVRNLVECLGYRRSTHPMVLLWQSLTAAKIWVDQIGIPDYCPRISEHPYLLTSPDGMGNITALKPISSVRELPFYEQLAMEMSGSLATLGMIKDFQSHSEVKLLLDDTEELFMDVIYLG